MALSQNWNLESIFPGGSSSQAYATYLDSLEAAIKELLKETSGPPPKAAEDWAVLLDHVQSLAKKVRHAGAFVGCLTAQNVKDDPAKLLVGRMRVIGAAYASALTYLDKHVVGMSEEQWLALAGDDSLAPIKFNLEERRRRAKEKMPTAQETLVNDLSIDGYHGWSTLYDTVVSRMSIAIEENGKTVLLSPGQAENKMKSPNREFREHVFDRWEEAWANEADFCALALNNLAGFRLNLYKHRGWSDVTYEPLDYNRMQPATLAAMWSAIDANKGKLVKFLKRKQELLGTDKLNWHDVNAPVGSVGSQMSFDAAANFIVEQFRRFNPAMADFTAKCFSERWIEAEDRPGKRPGAFCTTFPEKQESRVFMTFSGTMSNVTTLAHELGHAYHQSVMNELPPFAQQYAMNVAETASTFAEVAVGDAALALAGSQAEKITLMEDKLQRAATLLMNIQARYLFETRFYDERKRGVVSKQRLNELMVMAQKEAFADTLDKYHPHFWAAKLHFFNTGVPFYNFPYTFGYLFATGVYAQAMQEGPSFAKKYDDLLRDTGRMRTEDLALRHLGVDITRTEFWQSAIDSALAELDEFLALTAKA
ncbi:MAG: Oligoendopeptidase F, plasmid [Firmicutes bacterium]|nr:Oligoendopeptidase F, plasmid [candidate division NPL-UPA2 bacterium]MBT9155921.1 Oligoendopeptidase F, plasmid [candidate division NPL-UPA2 bacterium]